MEIQFTKMHGLGNDFVVIDAINQDVTLSDKQVRYISDRRFGVGCDQLLLVEESKDKSADFRYRIFNNDGGEVEQCGNGARCFAKFVHDQKLSDKAELKVSTKSGIIKLKLTRQPQTIDLMNGDEIIDTVTVDMDIPTLSPQAIPFKAKEFQTSYSIDIEGGIIEFGAVSMGNPHAVILVDDIDTAEIERIGKALQNNSHFPNSVNVGFMQIINRSQIKLRVYERGVGETLACGSGACAAVVSGKTRGLLDDAVETQLLGGNLSIHWAGEQNPVMMTGSASTVFKGKISL